MAIATSFDRPVASPTATKSTPLTAAIAELNGEFVVDIKTDVTQDDTDVVPKTVARWYLSREVVGKRYIFSAVCYVFPGSAADYASGGNTPLKTAGVVGNEIPDMSVFLTAAGDAP